MTRKNYQLADGAILDDRYKVEEVLGEGGFGITYAGRNERIGLKVAIKEFFCKDYMSRNVNESNETFLTDPDQKERFEKEKSRFLKEARILSDFSSENGIVHVNDYFEANGTAYIVMSFIDGITLKDYVKKNGPMDPEKLLRSMKPLIGTLGKIHAAGLLHRDISPDNIMLLEDGSLCLIDFGAAVQYDAKEKSYTMICKHSYSAPEMYRSTGDIAPSADLYSLAATLYYCLIGKEPADSLQRLLLDELAMPKQIDPNIPEGVNTIISKGLEIQPSARWQNTDDLLKEMEKVYPEKTEGTKKTISKKTILIIAIAAVVGIAAAIGLILYLPHRTEIRFRNIETEVIFLRPQEDITMQDYNQSVSVIKKRVEILAGKNNYLWKESEEGIRIELPVSVLAGEDPTVVCRAYLSRPLQYYFVNTDSQNIESIRTNALSFSKDDLENVEKRTGRLEDVDAIWGKAPETGDYDYLFITLTEKKAEAINDYFDDLLTAEHKGSILFIYEDLFNEEISSFYYFICVSAGDGRSLIMIDDHQEGNYIDVDLYNFTHDSGKRAFIFTTKPNDVNWEDPASSLSAGKAQVSEDAIEGPYVLLFYDAGESRQEHEANWFHNMVALKARLDTLETSYAIGMVEDNDSIIAIKAPHKAYSREKLDLLASSNGQLNFCYKWGKLYLPFQNALSYNSEGKITTYFSESYYQNDMLRGTGNLQEDGIDEIYLYLQECRYPIAKVRTRELAKMSSKTELAFEPLFEYDPTLLALINCCNSESVISSKTITISGLYFDGSNADFFRELEEDDFEPQIQSIYPEALEIIPVVWAFTEQMGGKITWSYEPDDGYSIDFFFFNEDAETMVDSMVRFANEICETIADHMNAGNIDSLKFYYSQYDQEAQQKNGYQRISMTIRRDEGLKGFSQMIGNYNSGLSSDAVYEQYEEAKKYFEGSSVDNFDLSAWYRSEIEK